MGDHRPEAKERRSGNANAQLREIALEKCQDELLAPAEAVRLAAGQIRNGESTATPVFPESTLADLLKTESTDGNRLDTPGETFRGLSKQARRSASQNEKTGACWTAVCEYAENGEQIRTTLDLIYHDGTADSGERSHRLIEPGETRGIFEVEIVGRVVRDYQPSSGGLTALAGADERNDGPAAQRCAQLPKEVGAGNEAVTRHLEK